VDTECPICIHLGEIFFWNGSTDISEMQLPKFVKMLKMSISECSKDDVT